jgi:hypothetical protein
LKRIHLVQAAAADYAYVNLSPRQPNSYSEWVFFRTMAAMGNVAVFNAALIGVLT